MNEKIVEAVAVAIFNRWAARPGSQSKVWEALMQRGRDYYAADARAAIAAHEAALAEAGMVIVPRESKVAAQIHTCPKCGARARFNCSEPGCPGNGGAAYG